MHLNPETPEEDLSIISGGGDKSLKMWGLTTPRATEDGGTKYILLEILRNITTTDDILTCMFSPNGKYITFALLDSTIKVINIYIYIYNIDILC